MSIGPKRWVRRPGAKVVVVVVGTTLFAARFAERASACDSTMCLLASRAQSGLAPKGALRVDFSFRYIDQSDRRLGTESTDAVNRPWVDFRDGRIWPGIHDDYAGIEKLFQLDLEYGIANNMSVFASVPVRGERRFSSGDDVCGVSNVTSGIGDTIVGVRRVIRRVGQGVVSATLGVKLPTGTSDARNARVSDVILDPMFQPGSGSLGGLGSIVYSFKALHPTLDWSAQVSYQTNAWNELHYRFGDEGIASITVARRLRGPVSASLQIKGTHERRNQFYSTALPSTGSTVLYATPGVRLNMKGVSLYSLVQNACVPARQ